MSKLKLKFMYMVCLFIKDWYGQYKDNSTAKDRRKELDDLLEEIETEYKTE